MIRKDFIFFHIIVFVRVICDQVVVYINRDIKPVSIVIVFLIVHTRMKINEASVPWVF